MNAQPPLVTATDFVFVPVRRFAEAAEFYEKTLGLACSTRYEKVPGGEFETGNLTLLLLEAAAIGREFAPNQGAIALHVDDVASARAALEASGVSFQGDTIDSGVCHQAIFADPDGNTLILHHRYAPRRV